MAISLGILTQHFQTNPHGKNISTAHCGSLGSLGSLGSCQDLHQRQQTVIACGGVHSDCGALNGVDGSRPFYWTIFCLLLVVKHFCDLCGVHQVVFALTWFIVVVMGWPCGTLALHGATEPLDCNIRNDDGVSRARRKPRIGPIEVIALIVFIGYARAPRAPRAPGAPRDGGLGPIGHRFGHRFGA